MLLSNSQRRRPVAAVLCLAIVSAPWSVSGASDGDPDRTQASALEERHLAGHGFVYRLELSGTQRSADAPIAQAEVRLFRRAEPSEVTERRRRAGSRPGRKLTRLSADEARELAGSSGWQERIHWSLSADENRVRSTYRVGSDTVSLALPVEWVNRTALPSGTFPPAELEVNGLVTLIDPDWLTTPGVADPEALARTLNGLERALRDRERFFESYLEFENVFGALHEQEPLSTPRVRRDSCFLACLRCAGSLVTYTGSTLALVAACGSALVSGGSTILICVGAFVGHEAAMIMALGACGGCSICHDERRRGDCCDCRGLPQCNCPPSCPDTAGPPPWSWRGTR